MTTDELRRKFNSKFGLDEWPNSYEVDAETYANVCQSIFKYKVEYGIDTFPVTYNTVDGIKGHYINLGLGPNNGIMFKDIELILKLNHE